MSKFNGQLAVALTAALTVLFLLSLLGLIAWMLWHPSHLNIAALTTAKWLIGFNVFCLAVVATLSCYLARRDHARNGRAGR